MYAFPKGGARELHASVSIYIGGYDWSRFMAFAGGHHGCYDWLGQDIHCMGQLVVTGGTGAHRAALTRLQHACVRVILKDFGFKDELRKFLFLIPGARGLHPVFELKIREVRPTELPLRRQPASASRSSRATQFTQPRNPPEHGATSATKPHTHDTMQPTRTRKTTVQQMSRSLHCQWPQHLRQARRMYLLLFWI